MFTGNSGNLGTLILKEPCKMAHLLPASFVFYVSDVSLDLTCWWGGFWTAVPQLFCWIFGGVETVSSSGWWTWKTREDRWPETERLGHLAPLSLLDTIMFCSVSQAAGVRTTWVDTGSKIWFRLCDWSLSMAGCYTAGLCSEQNQKDCAGLDPQSKPSEPVSIWMFPRDSTNHDEQLDKHKNTGHKPECITINMSEVSSNKTQQDLRCQCSPMLAKRFSKE